MGEILIEACMVVYNLFLLKVCLTFGYQLNLLIDTKGKRMYPIRKQKLILQVM